MDLVILIDQLSHNQVEEDISDQNINDDNELSQFNLTRKKVKIPNR